MEINHIFEQISPMQCRLVEITGGEPLIQGKTPILVEGLLEDGYEVLLETNGTQDISRVDDRCVKVVDLKCPSSGMSDHTDMENLNRLSVRDEIKFVLGTRGDYEYAREIVGHMKSRSISVSSVNFSPVFGQLEPETLAEWILADHLDCRLHLQLHKYIWGPDARGV